MGGCEKLLAKFGLIFFSAILLLSVLAVLGVGIWAKVDKYVVKMADLIQFDTDDKQLSNGALVLIGFRAFQFLVSPFGCLTACKRSKCLIVGFIMFLVIILCGEIAGGVTVAVFKKKIDKDLPSILQKTFDEYQPGNSLLANSWDYMQTWLQCCGSNGPKDYGKVKFNSAYTKMYVPNTCCILTNSDPENPKPKNQVECQKEAMALIKGNSTTYTYLEKLGCYASLNDKIKSHLALIISVGVGLGMFQLLGIVLAIWICKRHVKDEYDNAVL